MTATTKVYFLDTTGARLSALALAGLVAFLLYANWGAQILATIGGQPYQSRVVKSPASEATPALDACLAKRVGDVENMKSEGILNAAQYAAFKARAIDICRARNPTNP